jgi:hypothetical protein
VDGNVFSRLTVSFSHHLSLTPLGTWTVVKSQTFSPLWGVDGDDDVPSIRTTQALEVQHGKRSTTPLTSTSRRRHRHPGTEHSPHGNSTTVGQNNNNDISDGIHTY